MARTSAKICSSFATGAAAPACPAASGSGSAASTGFAAASGAFGASETVWGWGNLMPRKQRLKVYLLVANKRLDGRDTGLGRRRTIALLGRQQPQDEVAQRVGQLRNDRPRVQDKVGFDGA